MSPDHIPTIPAVVYERRFPVETTILDFERAELVVRGLHYCAGGTAPCRVGDQLMYGCHVILGTAIPGYRPEWAGDGDEDPELDFEDYPATGLAIPLDLIPAIVAAMTELAAPPSEKEAAEYRAEYERIARSFG